MGNKYETKMYWGGKKMSLYYFTKRNSLFGRVCSYVLTFVLVLSMALGCVVLPQRVSTSVKAATTAKYRNVMY